MVALIVTCGILALIIYFMKGRIKSTEAIQSGTSWQPKSSIPHITGNQTYSFTPTATSHFQDNLEKICGGKTEDGHDKKVVAVFIPEKNNPDDHNAINITINNLMVGRVIHHITNGYREALKARDIAEKTVSFDAKIVGGWYRPSERSEGNFGVRVDLPSDFFEFFRKEKTLKERLNEQQ